MWSVYAFNANVLLSAVNNEPEGMKYRCSNVNIEMMPLNNEVHVHGYIFEVKPSSNHTD